MNHLSLSDFVIYSGSRVAELLDGLYKADDVLAEISCVVIELEDHQRALEEKIGNEPDMAIRGQADQYQTNLSKTIEAYKNLENALGSYQNEEI